MVKKKKMIIAIIATIIMVTTVAGITIIIISKSKTKNEQEQSNSIQENIDREKLEMEFNQEFLSAETEYVKIRMKIERSKNGKYDIQAYLPKLTCNGEDAKAINKEIYETAAIILNEAVNVEKYSKYTMEFTSFVNNDILSLVIRFTVKEENNPRRIIIKTYNYDLVNEKQISLLNITNEEQREKLENSIKTKIEEKNKLAEQKINKGYEAYVRDLESDIYKIENATEFFIGNDNILYIVYAYGNQKYTDEVDLIIYKL